MNNYSELLSRAGDIIRKARGNEVGGNLLCRTTHYVAAADVVSELAEALVTVCRQNRNLRQDLERMNRDFEANLEELMCVGQAVQEAESQNSSLQALAQMLSENRQFDVVLNIVPRKEGEV